MSDVGAKQLIDGELSEFEIDACDTRWMSLETEDRVQIKFINSVLNQLNLQFTEVEQLEAFNEQSSQATY